MYPYSVSRDPTRSKPIVAISDPVKMIPLKITYRPNRGLEPINSHLDTLSNVRFDRIAESRVPEENPEDVVGVDLNLGL